jgi:hypothetical protein
LAIDSLEDERLVNVLEYFIQKGMGKRVKDHLIHEHFPSVEHKDRDTGQVTLNISTPGISSESIDPITQAK